MLLTSRGVSHISKTSLSALWLIASACAQPQPPPLAPRATPPVARSVGEGDCSTCEQQVGAVIDDFHAAAAAAKEARYFDHLTEDAVFLGTDATERWTKAEFRAYARPHFQEGKAWTFRATRRTIALADSGSLAWFEETLDTENLGPARGSGVLLRQDGRWRIAQYNLALTIPNARFFLVKEAAETARVTSAPAQDSLASLAWLSGAWLSEKPDGERGLEVWTHPSAGTMIGSGHSVKAGKTSFFEYMRIEALCDEVVYTAQPRGGKPTAFKRVGNDPEALVFENPKHDWPKRLTYARVATGVRVRVEGGPGQPVEEWVMAPAVIARQVVESP